MFDHKFWDKLDKQIPGWMSKEEAEFLVENVQEDRYLEIGVAYGKSLSIIRHHFPDMDIQGIDKVNHGIDGVLLGDANDIWFKDVCIDTLFIDGDHTYKGCLSDFVHWYNKVKSGGKIIFHDYGRPTEEHEGVTQTVDAIKPLLKDFKKTNFICCGTKN